MGENKGNCRMRKWICWRIRRGECDGGGLKVGAEQVGFFIVHTPILVAMEEMGHYCVRKSEGISANLFLGLPRFVAHSLIVRGFCNQKVFLSSWQ